LVCSRPRYCAILRKFSQLTSAAYRYAPSST
jgi:hypothetical protein